MKKRYISVYIIIMTILITSVLSRQVKAGSDPGDVINTVAWNSDGTLLAAGHADGTIKIVSVINGSSTSLDLERGFISSLFWNPVHQNQLAVTTGHGGLKLLEIDNNQLRIINLSFKTDQEHVEQVEWSPDGKRLATIETRGSGVGGIRKVMLWNPETGDLLASFENGSIFGDIAWNPQKPNELLITAIVEDYDKRPVEILVWNVEENKVLWQIEEPNTGVTYVAWRADGTQFAALTTVFTDDGGGISRVQIYSGDIGEKLSLIPIDEDYWSSEISWSPGQYLAIQGDNSVDIWDTENNNLDSTIQGAELISAFAWSPNGSTLAYGQIDGKLEFVSPHLQNQANP